MSNTRRRPYLSERAPIGGADRNCPNGYMHNTKPRRIVFSPVAVSGGIKRPCPCKNIGVKIVIIVLYPTNPTKTTSEPGSRRPRLIETTINLQSAHFVHFCEHFRYRR